METIFTNILIFSNVILVYIIRELWKDNKKKNEIIRLQDNLLKSEGIIKKI
jgi:hypothetical protein